MSLKTLAPEHALCHNKSSAARLPHPDLTSEEPVYSLFSQKSFQTGRKERTYHNDETP